MLIRCGVISGKLGRGGSLPYLLFVRGTSENGLYTTFLCYWGKGYRDEWRTVLGFIMFYYIWLSFAEYF